MTAEPLVPFVPSALDPDWETIRARMAAALAATGVPEWTDHNPSDPGITLGESAGFGLADVHYRLAETAFQRWPLAWQGWLPTAQRHWDAALPVPAPSEPAAPPALAPLASALAAAAEELEPLVRACASRADADMLLAQPEWAAIVPGPVAASVVAVLRGRWVRQVALEHADVIGDAVTQADASTGTRAARDAAAAAELAFRLPLWPSELAAVVRRERSMLAQEAAAGASRTLAQAATAAERADAVAGLIDAGLTAAEAAAASALARIPAGMVPEDLETADGQSLIWPPHAIQALTCEPVTDQDYATRARQHPQVGRAWAVRGRLAGVAWNGLPVLATGEALPVVSGSPWPASITWREDAGAHAVTLVVDRVAGASNTREFLRDVLALAVGTEVRHPFPIWRDNLGALDPRRLVGDEVGAALLRRVDVVVAATLVLPVTADSAAVKADVGARIAAFFEQGRPERAVATPDPTTIDGPWPPAPQPPGGWFPGEAIRFTEVVQAIVGNPQVIGVQDVGLKLAGSGPLLPFSAGELLLPAGSVPVLASGGCLETVLAVSGGCSDA